MVTLGSKSPASTWMPTVVYVSSSRLVSLYSVCGLSCCGFMDCWDIGATNRCCQWGWTTAGVLRGRLEEKGRLES